MFFFESHTKAYPPPPPPPQLLGPFGVCWFGVDRPRRDDEPCFDILGFHHVYAECHTRAYLSSYRDHLEFAWFGVDHPY